MPLGHKKQRKNRTEMDHPQKCHLQKSAAQAEMNRYPMQGSHFVGHYGKIVSNRMGVFFNAQIFKRSKT